MAKKSEEKEVRQRILQITEWLLQGFTNYKIVKYCEDEWQIKQTQAYNYIKRAFAIIEETYQKEFKENLSWHLVARKKLLEKASKKDNTNEALAILRDIAELQGYYKIQHEISGKDGEPIRILRINRPDESIK